MRRRSSLPALRLWFMLQHRHSSVSGRLPRTDGRDSRWLLSSSRLSRRGAAAAMRECYMSFLRMRLAERRVHARLWSRSVDDGRHHCRCDQEPDRPHERLWPRTPFRWRVGYWLDSRASVRESAPRRKDVRHMDRRSGQKTVVRHAFVWHGPGIRRPIVPPGPLTT